MQESDLTVTPQMLDAFECSLGEKKIHCMSAAQMQILIKTIRNAWAERDSLRGELHALRTFVAQGKSSQND